ncbi:hypothetical protein NDU88_009835 [Pleurodeles waltl]|uniref:Uncharacterized protein n=1 Tax=Pleurodeles waltl TaxID=8319 RepID=A0AAV7S059_PLEWA|nr:hypothetical protein NDU88_009835 [Pleurodeles waltl]
MSPCPLYYQKELVHLCYVKELVDMYYRKERVPPLTPTHAHFIWGDDESRCVNKARARDSKRSRLLKGVFQVHVVENLPQIPEKLARLASGDVRGPAGIRKQVPALGRPRSDLKKPGDARFFAAQGFMYLPDCSRRRAETSPHVYGFNKIRLVLSTGHE